MASQGSERVIINQNLGKHVILEQDNKSAIQLERNGVQSSTRRTKHINCRYYYVTDRIKSGDITVVYRPTAGMCSNYHTKGLTGAPFIKHRETLMGIEPQTELTLYKKYKKSQVKN